MDVKEMFDNPNPPLIVGERIETLELDWKIAFGMLAVEVAQIAGPDLHLQNAMKIIERVYNAPVFMRMPVDDAEIQA